MTFQLPDAASMAKETEAQRKRKGQQEAFTPNEMGIAADELRQFIERIERLEEEKKSLADDIKDVMAELKGRGYDPKAVRAILRLRKQDPDERHEAEAVLELYMNALGMA